MYKALLPYFKRTFLLARWALCFHSNDRQYQSLPPPSALQNYEMNHSPKQTSLMMALRRAPLPLHYHGPHSSKGSDSEKSRFSYLSDSPLPSPGLPSILPRHGKKVPSSRYQGFLRLLLWACGLSLVIWFALLALSFEKPPSTLNYLSNDGKAYEIVGDSTLPRRPSPVIVTDRRGRSKWTVSIPPDLAFPLQPKGYSDLCAQSADVSKHVAELKSPGSVSHHGGHSGYYRADPNYMDVGEAEEHGMLPGTRKKQAQVTWKVATTKNTEKDSMSEDLETVQRESGRPVCRKSLTYVLQTSDAGFGKTLMGLWMSYGLAKKEGRAFFIDDTNW